MSTESNLSLVLRRAARNALWLIVSEALGKALLVVANIYLARELASYGYGTLALAQTWVLYAALAVDFGIGMYGQREAAKRNGPAELGRLADEIFVFKSALGFLVFVFFSVVCWFLVSQPVLRLTELACSLYLLGYGASLDWLFRGCEKYSIALLVNASSSVCFLASLFFFVSSSNDAPMAGFLWAGSSLLASALYLVHVPRLIGRPVHFRISLSALLSHCRDCVFFWLSGAFMQSYQYLPLVLLGWLATKQTVGLFAAPYRLIIQLGSLGFLLPMAFYPISSRLFKENSGLFNESCRLLVFIMLLCGLPIAIWGSIVAVPLIVAIFGPEFRESATLFRIIVWLVPLFFIRYVYGSTMLATGFQRIHLRASMFGFLVALTLGILLGSILGGVGVAASVVAAESAIIGALVFYSRRVYGRLSLPSRSQVARLLLLNVGLGAAGVWLNGQFGWVLSMVFAVLSYPVGLWTLRLVSIHQVSELLLGEFSRHASEQA